MPAAGEEFELLLKVGQDLRAYFVEGGDFVTDGEGRMHGQAFLNVRVDALVFGRC